jgi:hypothetical protein
MSHVYRLVWNDLLRTWVAVAEIVKGRGKPSGASVGRAATPAGNAAATQASVATDTPSPLAANASSSPTTGGAECSVQ